MINLPALTANPDRRDATGDKLLIRMLHQPLSRAAWAGFPSPAEDHLDQNLDLNQHLIKHPEATYLVKVRGDSMTGAGIGSDDILIVDRAIEAADNRVIIACINGELFVKRIRTIEGKLFLWPENEKYKPIE